MLIYCLLFYLSVVTTDYTICCDSTFEFGSKEVYCSLCWDKTRSHEFGANQTLIKMGLLAYNLPYLVREFYVVGEEVKRSIVWIIRWMVKVASSISYHSRCWWVHLASAFPLLHHYQTVFSFNLRGDLLDNKGFRGSSCLQLRKDSLFGLLREKSCFDKGSQAFQTRPRDYMISNYKSLDSTITWH